MRTSIILFLFITALSVCGQSFVAENGMLNVDKTQLCNKDGKPIQLRGFSTHNTTFCPECVTFEAIQSNRDFWEVNVARVAIYTDDWWNKQSYNNNPEYSKALVDSMVRWTEKLGIYCIIDWHILTKGNPNSKIHAGADSFFEEMSRKYGKKEHVLYEICNEPNGSGVTWDTIADYANRIIPIIRKNAPKSVIIIGTPFWCQHIDKVDTSKIKDPKNIMYAFHFYAATHQSLLPILEKEMHRIPIFATEWGVCEATGNGDINFESSEKFINAMNQHVSGTDTVMVSWCLFSYGDKKEAASVLEPESCTKKQWDNMSPTGFFIRKQLQKSRPPTH